jgi:energy-coupling factor transporter ATP-binding protein EcfA2
LLSIVRQAYLRLPAHAFNGVAPRFCVRLTLTNGYRTTDANSELPRMLSLSAGGMLCGAMETASFVALMPELRSALVVVPRDMLGFPYHVRYEMLEFAVYVLAARVQGLVPLHAACVGRGGEGILLLGRSGAGKTTLALHCLLHGLEFLAEDSVLIAPSGLCATGIANFLHVRRDSLRFLDSGNRAALLARSSAIRRRSGVEKLEIDLRRPRYRLASAPLRIRALVFLSPKPAGARTLLAPVPQSRLRQRLAESQRYAAHQPGWAAFARQVHCLPAFELRRAHHPHQAVEALQELLPPEPRTPTRKRGGP